MFPLHIPGYRHRYIFFSPWKKSGPNVNFSLKRSQVSFRYKKKRKKRTTDTLMREKQDKYHMVFGLYFSATIWSRGEASSCPPPCAAWPSDRHVRRGRDPRPSPAIQLGRGIPSSSKQPPGFVYRCRWSGAWDCQRPPKLHGVAGCIRLPSGEPRPARMRSGLSPAGRSGYRTMHRGPSERPPVPKPRSCWHPICLGRFLGPPAGVLPSPEYSPCTGRSACWCSVRYRCNTAWTDIWAMPVWLSWDFPAYSLLPVVGFPRCGWRSDRPRHRPDRPHDNCRWFFWYAVVFRQNQCIWSNCCRRGHRPLPGYRPPRRSAICL